MTLTRVAAAAVGLVILLPSMLYGGELAIEIIVAVAAVIAVSEFATMAFGEDRWVLGGVLLAGWGAVYGTALYGPSELLFVVFGVGTAGILTWQTLRPGPQMNRTADLAGRLLLGVAWLSCFAFLVLLRRADHGLSWLFLVLVISWLGDTGAYFAGRAFGRTKLYPAISPKKTWEGVVGGVILATVGVFVVRAVGLPVLSVMDCLVLGPVLCLAGVVGDLGESMLKRSFEVKDSGWILPGHGGILDRVDSVLFVAPLLYAWVLIVEAPLG
ncbi:MAG: phosphatidate cytidylyltransferase [Myxococcales bacterium]|nr:phosphatidate cytidylyltransferase [Myxococcales bacterium]